MGINRGARVSLLPTPDDAGAAAPSDEPLPAGLAEALHGGEIARELGLDAADLRLGLTVAKNLLSRGAHAEAMRVYVALVLCEPLNVDFQVGLANCASVVGEPYMALQAASAVIALAPSDPRGYLLSGRSCMAIGNFAEAREDLTDALRFADTGTYDVVRREAGLLIDRLTAAGA